MAETVAENRIRSKITCSEEVEVTTDKTHVAVVPRSSSKQFFDGLPTCSVLLIVRPGTDVIRY